MKNKQHMAAILVAAFFFCVQEGHSSSKSTKKKKKVVDISLRSNAPTPRLHESYRQRRLRQAAIQDLRQRRHIPFVRRMLEANEQRRARTTATDNTNNP